MFTQSFGRLAAVTFILSVSAACSTSEVVAPPAPATPLTPATVLSTPDDAVFVTIALSVKPEQMDEFLAMMTAAAPATRNWDGCRLFDIYVNPDKAGEVMFFEIWDSKEQQQAYVAWRGETGFNDKLGPFLAGGVTFSYLDKVPY